MEDVNNNANEDERKARLIEEAKNLKVAFDPNWTSEQLEKVVSKKRAAARANAEKASPAPKPAPSPPPVDREAAGQMEGDDDVELTDVDPRIGILEADLATAIADLATAKAEIERLTKKTKDQQDVIFALQKDKDAADLALFNLKQKVGTAPKDNPKTSEDFGGEKEAPPAGQAAVERRPSRDAATVRVTVTKHGHNQIFTGDDKGSRYQRGAQFEVDADIAASLEGKGWVEAD